MWLLLGLLILLWLTVLLINLGSINYEFISRMKNIWGFAFIYSWWLLTPLHRQAFSHSLQKRSSSLWKYVFRATWCAVIFRILISSCMILWRSWNKSLFGFFNVSRIHSINHWFKRSLSLWRLNRWPNFLLCSPYRKHPEWTIRTRRKVTLIHICLIDYMVR